MTTSLTDRFSVSRRGESVRAPWRRNRSCQVSIHLPCSRDMTNQPDPTPDDPLGLKHAEHEIRIEKLRRQIEEVTGEEVASGKSAECPPELEEAFLENVLALEEHGFACPFDVLTSEGFKLPPPDELDDAALTAKLWELIGALARHRLFLSSTDHLSDRAVYAWLWSDALHEEMMGFGLPSGNFFLDVLGACGEEDTLLRMRFYADEAERARFAADFPDSPMPPRERPPFDRDKRLPKPDWNEQEP
jgi:hypothetical protein